MSNQDTIYDEVIDIPEDQGLVVCSKCDRLLGITKLTADEQRLGVKEIRQPCTVDGGC